jgi:hypothetical protein
MFLDEELYEWTMLKEINSPDDFYELINELYNMSEDNYKPLLKENDSCKQIRLVMDRLFRSWDLFISRLEKEKWPFVRILSTSTYKISWLSNPKLLEIYNKGK